MVAHAYCRHSNGPPVVEITMAATSTSGNAGGQAKLQEHAEVKKIERDPILAEINRRIMKAFDSFDRDGNQTVDVR